MPAIMGSVPSLPLTKQRGKKSINLSDTASIWQGWSSPTFSNDKREKKGKQEDMASGSL